MGGGTAWRKRACKVVLTGWCPSLLISARVVDSAQAAEVEDTSASDDESEDDKISKDGREHADALTGDVETAEKSGSADESENTPSDSASGSEDIGEEDTEGEIQSGSEGEVGESDVDTGKSLLSNVIRKYELLSHHMEMGMLSRYAFLRSVCTVDLVMSQETCENRRRSEKPTWNWSTILTTISLTTRSWSSKTRSFSN
jgi:hypothetical protein